MEEKKNEIIVSVICLAYNHEKYIKRALDSFVGQKTSFKFEVIVHDDASTDSTAEIVRMYAEKYPQIIKPIFQEENQFRHNRYGFIKQYVFPALKGEYVAWCEGDDYWTDCTKLQKQVDVFKSHSDCAACYCKVERVSIDEAKLGSYFPAMKINSGMIPNDRYYRYSLSNGFPWQLSGLMTNAKVYYDYVMDSPFYKDYFEVGDLPLFLYVGLKGEVYYIDETLSNYRTGNSESWIGRTNQDNNEKARYFCRKARAYKAFDQYSGRRYHDYVTYIVKSTMFDAYAKRHDLKRMKLNDMKQFYDKITIKWKLYHYLCHFFPGIEGFLIHANASVENAKRRLCRKR